MRQKLKAACKVSGIVFFIFTFLITSIFLGWISPQPMKLAKRRARLISLYSQLGLWILGVKTRVENRENFQAGSLIVCNHLSYLDVLVLAAEFPANFVTSVEIKETPFLGQIVQAAGCLFVERRDKSNIQNEVREITNALKRGLTVTIFPEATSTNGEAVLRFRRPLYNSSILSETPVQPMCLNYLALDGKKLTLENRDHVFWYGDMSFLPHLWDMAQYSQIEVELQVLEAVRTEPTTTPEHLADLTHTMVRSAFSPCLI